MKELIAFRMSCLSSLCHYNTDIASMYIHGYHSMFPYYPSSCSSLCAHVCRTVGLDCSFQYLVTKIVKAAVRQLKCFFPHEIKVCLRNIEPQCTTCTAIVTLNSSLRRVMQDAYFAWYKHTCFLPTCYSCS